MAPTIDQIPTAMIDGYPTFTTDEQHLAQVVYRLLAAGRPAAPEAIAAGAGWAVADVTQRLDAWPAVFRNDAGAVVGFWGLTCKPVTGHRIDIDGIGAAWTWCSYDTLFIAHLLGATAHISAHCSTTGQPVTFTVSPDGVRDVEPAEAAISLLQPDAPFDDDVRKTFCHYVLFFASPDAARRWTATNPGTFWLSLADAFEVAVGQNAAVFPALVGDPARR